MKLLLSLCFFLPTAVTAFSVVGKSRPPSSLVLKATTESKSEGATLPPSSGQVPPTPIESDKTTSKSDLWFPEPPELPLRTIQGANTLVTMKMPVENERVCVYIKTNGRPTKAAIEMWLGPLRRTHKMDIYCQDGSITPFREVLKFKKGDNAGPQVLKVCNIGEMEFPIEAGVECPTKEKDALLASVHDDIWKKHARLIQGGTIQTFPVADNVDSVQLLMSSRNFGRWSIKGKIEVLKGPNNIKQKYDLHCGGGSQPYHCIFETPGSGWTVRITSKNLLEFPYSVAVVPYKVSEAKPQLKMTGPDSMLRTKPRW